MRSFVALMAVAAALVGCTVRDLPEPVPVSAIGARGPYQTGPASYYHDRFSGRRTANGERYDPKALTAAHRHLPLGTIVDVVRRDGRAVRVRINDRGPYVAGRIIDLSRHAAGFLGMLHAGVVDVAIYVVWIPGKERKGREDGDFTAETR